MKLLSVPFAPFFWKNSAPAPMTVSQDGRKARITRKLIAQGQITLREIANMGDNHPTKTVLRLREDGLLFPRADDRRGFKMAPNASGQGEHKVYLWTGNMPRGEKWLERRKQPRGGRS